MTTPRASSSSLITTNNEPASRSLNRQVILEEDEYTAALSAIIARDFFPSLAHIDATNTYLNALDSQDPTQIDASIRRLSDLGPTPQHRTPWQQKTPFANTPSDTPIRTPSTSSRPAKKPKFDTSLSLDAFQAKYTSEDNASFTEILDEENRQRKIKYGWAWDAEKRVAQLKGKEIEGRERLLLTSTKEGDGARSLKIEGPEPLKAIEAAPEGESETPFDPWGINGVPSDVPDTSQSLVLRESSDNNTLSSSGDDDGGQSGTVDVLAPRKDTRSAAVPGWRFKNRNALMFPPDADESPYHPDPLSTVTADPKEIKHSNTRLPSQSEHVPELPIPPSPTRSRIGAAIAGTPYHPATPQVGGFGFVDALPSPSPEQLGPEAVKQLMTWGSLLGTPRVVRDDDATTATTPFASTSNPFKINDPTTRDALGRRLGSQASKSLREKAALLSSSTPRVTNTPARKRKGDMPPPDFTPRRAGFDMLSPAAKTLLHRTKAGGGSLGYETPSRVIGTPRVKPKGGVDLRKVGWSPKDTPVARGAGSGSV